MSDHSNLNEKEFEYDAKFLDENMNSIFYPDFNAVYSDEEREINNKIIEIKKIRSDMNRNKSVGLDDPYDCWSSSEFRKFEDEITKLVGVLEYLKSKRINKELL